MAMIILITLSALWETQAAVCLEQSIKVRNGKTTAAWCGTIQSEKRCEISYTLQKSKRYQCYWEGTSCFTPDLTADKECPTTTAITTTARTTTTTTTLKTTEATTTRTSASTTSTSVSTTTISVSSSSTASTSTSRTIPSTTHSTSTSSSSATSTVASTSISTVSSSSSASRTIATTSLNAITSSIEVTSSRQADVSTTSPNTRTTTIDTTLPQSTEKVTTTSNNTSAIATIDAITTATTVTESFDATTSTAKTSSTSFRKSVSTNNAASTAPFFAVAPAPAPASAQLGRENIIVLVVSGGVLFCVISVIVFIICVCRKRDKRKDEYDSSSHDSTPGLTIYTDPSQIVRPNLPIDDYNNSPMMQVPPVEDKTTHIIQVAEEYEDSPYPSTNEYNSDED